MKNESEKPRNADSEEFDSSACSTNTKASRWWRWNRLVAWVYHFIHGIDEIGTGPFAGSEHLEKCGHCRKHFEKYLKRKYSK